MNNFIKFIVILDHHLRTADSWFLVFAYIFELSSESRTCADFIAVLRRAGQKAFIVVTSFCIQYCRAFFKLEDQCEAMESVS